MAARTAAAHSPQKAQRELEDLQLVLKARNGNSVAMDALIRRYTGFVRLKASSYFLAGGDGDDLIQEGLIGLYKAVRDFRARLAHYEARYQAVDDDEGPCVHLVDRGRRVVARVVRQGASRLCADALLSPVDVKQWSIGQIKRVRTL